MSLISKIFFLLLAFLLLNVFSIYAFDYEGHLSKDSSNTSIQQSSFSDEIISFKNKIFEMFEEKKEEKPANIVLVKKNGLIEMSGIFASEEEAKRITDILNVNREGEYKYEDNRVVDENLLKNLTNLVVPLKDFFSDGSKITFLNNEVSLEGELKDSNYRDLLNALINKTDISLKTDIKDPVKVVEKDLNVGNSSTVKEPKEEKEVVETKDSIEDIQLKINNLLNENKITFERRSTVLTMDSKSVVEKIANVLKENPTLKFEVAGHTDSRGKASLNKRISQDRANSVKEELITLGINKDNITAIGYGEKFPIAKDDKDGLSEINRRVEINILGEK